MLISEDYKAQQRELHQNEYYGTASVSYAPLVTNLINQLQIDEMLDYGAGKGRLAESIKPDRKLLIELYDPAQPDWSDTPSPRQFVTCIDVLEHIEPELLNNVLNDLQRVTKQYGFFTIHTGPAVKVLNDGRNAHLIQEDFRWWLPKLWSRFDIHSMSHTPSGFNVVVKANGNNDVRIIKAGD
jgi:hypothetical protein